MKHRKPFGYNPDTDVRVIDLAAYRRGRSERAGHTPAVVAAHLLATTGTVPAWPGDDDYDGWDDAA
ncbi:hypothetical protein [Nocardia thailandica]